jgi:hypothetical protein
MSLKDKLLEKAVEIIKDAWFQWSVVRTNVDEKGKLKEILD